MADNIGDAWGASLRQEDEKKQQVAPAPAKGKGNKQGKGHLKVLESMVNYFKNNPNAAKVALGGAAIGAIAGGKKGAMLGGALGLMAGRAPHAAQATTDLLAGTGPTGPGAETRGGAFAAPEGEGRRSPLADGPTGPGMGSGGGMMAAPEAGGVPAASPAAGGPPRREPIWSPEERAAFRERHLARMGSAGAGSPSAPSPPNDYRQMLASPNLAASYSPSIFEDRVGQAATQAMSEEEKRRQQGRKDGGAIWRSLSDTYPSYSPWSMP